MHNYKKTVRWLFIFYLQSSHLPPVVAVPWSSWFPGVFLAPVCGDSMVIEEVQSGIQSLQAKGQDQHEQQKKKNIPSYIF